MPPIGDRIFQRLIASSLNALLHDLASGRIPPVRLALEQETWLPWGDPGPTVGADRLELTRRLCREAALALHHEPAPVAAAILIRRARALWMAEAEDQGNGEQ